MSAAQLDKLITVLRERAVDRPNPLDVAPMRARMEELGDKFLAPADAVVAKQQVGACSAEWVAAPGTDADRHVLYLHGGGYVMGSPDIYRALAYTLSQHANAQVLVLDYRLAPEHRFPTARDDAVAAYTWMLAGGSTPEKIAIAGDSAGGGLTIASLCALRDQHQPLPAAAVSISPWTDLSGTSDSITARAERDPVVDEAALHWFAGLYLDGADVAHPAASPVHADLHGLPPLLVQVGGAEILFDDATRLTENARAAGVDVTLRIWEDMIHVWHLFAPMLDEGHEGLREAGTFIQEHCS